MKITSKALVVVENILFDYDHLLRDAFRAKNLDDECCIPLSQYAASVVPSASHRPDCSSDVTLEDDPTDMPSPHGAF